MRLKRAKQFLVGALFTVLVMLGASTIPAQAQHRGFHHGGGRIVVLHRGFFPHPWGWGWNYPYYNGYYDSAAYQQDTGYHDGFSRGKSDAKHGGADDPSSHKHYRNADTLTYRNAFAQGYENGYQEGLRKA